ncbi:MAG: TRAP transporter small permease [Caulobacterales bacterium]|nr:TRAP transporter small permease [Caulobacterales bacterium]
MSLAGLLGVIGRAERALCVLAFFVMAAALIADVASRQLFSTGLIGAPQIGVVGMIAAAMFGMGIATDAGSHLRPRLFDALIPARFSALVERLADALTAAFFALMGGLAVMVVAESFALGDRMAVLNWPIWPMQIMIAAAFGTNAARFAVFSVQPSLRPAPEIAEIETMGGSDAGEEAR